jgi:hypothetical protein
MGGMQGPMQQGDFQNQGQLPINMGSVSSDSNDTVSLLSEANESADVLETIPNGMPIEIIEEDGDYTKVSIRGMVGYILSEYISDEIPEPPEKPEDDSDTSNQPGFPPMQNPQMNGQQMPMPQGNPQMNNQQMPMPQGNQQMNNQQMPMPQGNPQMNGQQMPMPQGEPQMNGQQAVMQQGYRQNEIQTSENTENGNEPNLKNLLKALVRYIGG